MALYTFPPRNEVDAAIEINRALEMLENAWTEIKMDRALDPPFYFGLKLVLVIFSQCIRFPVVSVGIIRWAEMIVSEPNFFSLSTDYCPVQLALLDEVVTCHPLLHSQVGRTFSGRGEGSNFREIIFGVGVTIAGSQGPKIREIVLGGI